jgi:hypothetical protein
MQGQTRRLAQKYIQSLNYQIYVLCLVLFTDLSHTYICIHETCFKPKVGTFE